MIRRFEHYESLALILQEWLGRIIRPCCTPKSVDLSGDDVCAYKVFKYNRIPLWIDESAQGLDIAI